LNLSLNKIIEYGRPAGFGKLLTHLGKSQTADGVLGDDSVDVATLLDFFEFDDIARCLETAEGHDHELRLFSLWCAQNVQYLMTDPRSIHALSVAQRFANGQASIKELELARDEASLAAHEQEYAMAAKASPEYDLSSPRKRIRAMFEKAKVDLKATAERASVCAASAAVATAYPNAGSSVRAAANTSMAAIGWATIGLVGWVSRLSFEIDSVTRANQIEKFREMFCQEGPIEQLSSSPQMSTREVCVENNYQTSQTSRYRTKY